MQPIDLSGARIAIVMMSAIGDAVHVLPVVNALKRHAPGAHVTWLLQPLPATLVRGHPRVDEIVEVDPSGGLRAYAGLARALRGRRFDLVIDLQVAFKAGLATALLRAPVKLGFDRARARDANWLFTNRRIPPHAPQHVQEQYFEFLRHLGVDPEPPEWRLGPWEHERAWQREFFADFARPAAAINLATSNPDRDWMPERWAAVVDALWERWGVESVLVGGRSPRELELEARVTAAARHRPRSALGSGLRRLVSILDGSALVLALDSAPLHISVALGRPVISLMANADPRRTGPFRRFHDLVVDAYHDPGETAPVSMRRRRRRMGRITVEQVLEKVELWHRTHREAP
ncbi:MAG TPA: glycosyltransferase family 9 protein [Longimicrobiaceae bacterium]|nr:glycosyltransferase family 9 protein [Longimicrobiaceae bacterium]